MLFRPQPERDSPGKGWSRDGADEKHGTLEARSSAPLISRTISAGSRRICLGEKRDGMMPEAHITSRRSPQPR